MDANFDRFNRITEMDGNLGSSHCLRALSEWEAVLGFHR